MSCSDLNYSITDNLTFQIDNFTFQSDNNYTLIWQCPKQHTENWANIRLVAVCVYVFLGWLSLIGNCVMITAMSRTSLIRSGGYLAVVHYAMTDLINGLLLGVYMPAAIIAHDPFVPTFVPAILLTFAEISRKAFLGFIACTRFYSVMFSVRARLTMTLSWYKRSLWSVWALSFIICLPLWSYRSNYFDLCTFRFGFNQKTKYWTSVYMFACNTVVTLVIMTSYPICFLYLRRKSYLWKNGSYNGMQHIPSGGSRLSSVAKERAVFYLFFLNSLIFILYWVPIYLFEWWKISLPNYGLIKEIIRGVQVSYNPYVYYWLNYGIRKSVNNFITCKSKNKYDRKKSRSKEETY